MRSFLRCPLTAPYPWGEAALFFFFVFHFRLSTEGVVMVRPHLPEMLPVQGAVFAY